MTDLRLFGSAQCPLRASALKNLIQCPLRAVAMFLGEFSDSSGKAADTGSLVHAAAEHWHREKDAVAALGHMRSRAADFPKGDTDEAAKTFAFYANDPRNQEAEIAALEVNVTLTLPCSTGGLVYVTGRGDQVRRENGRLRLWDIKTGERFQGWEMVHIAGLQLAAYVLGAERKLNETVHPGGIIRTRGYRTRGAKLPSPDGVFFEAPFDRKDCERLLAGVSCVVASIRSGCLWAGPSDGCNSCPAGGLGTCLPVLERLVG